MYEEAREEIETILDGLDAVQTQDGSRQLKLPCGIVLNLMFPDGSPDLYAEAEVAELPTEGDVEARCRDLCSLNLFWRDLGGFTVATRNGMLFAQDREDMARLADEDDFNDWLVRADTAVRTIREVGLAPRYDEPPEDSGEDAAAPETEKAREVGTEGGMLWA